MNDTLVTKCGYQYTSMILSTAKVPYYQNQIIETNISNIENINNRFIQCCIADKSKTANFEVL